MVVPAVPKMARRTVVHVPAAQKMARTVVVPRTVLFSPYNANLNSLNIICVSILILSTRYLLLADFFNGWNFPTHLDIVFGILLA
jgi:hypothetical protein